MILRRRVIQSALLVIGLGLISGCGEPAPVVDFQTAEQANHPVTVSGRVEPMSLRQQSGRAAEFVLREEGTDRRLQVRAATGVPVPSNLTSATHATVTGTYQAIDRVFEATQVETRVPPREEQPGG